MHVIRAAEAADSNAIAALAAASGLFPAELLPAMIGPYLAGDTDALWLVAERDGLAGFLYSQAEMLTDGTHNLRAMATAEAARCQGLGSALIDALERALAAAGQRVMLVETSSTDAFAETRTFYRNRGFREEARITGFLAEGDDKVVFWKSVR